MKKAKPQKTWVYSPPKPPKPKVPESLKEQVKAEADRLVEASIKPQHLLSPPPDARFNYIVDIFTKWYRSYFYFCSTYRCPQPDSLVPHFESRFARLEYAGDGRFNLAFMRHTGQWWEMYTGLTLEEALTAVRDEPHFHP